MSTTTTSPQPVLRLVRTAPPAARAGRLLARAEFRLARRRRITLFTPMALAAASATVRLIGARHERLAAGFWRTLLGDVLVLAWTSLLVLVPFGAAIKPNPVRAGALAALLFGPLLTPALFGPGGWGPFEIVLALAACAGALVRPPSALRS